MGISDRILQLRKEKGISQEELADKIGVSRQAVSKWESKQSTPDIEKIVLLSHYFQTTTDYLLKGIESKEIKDKKSIATIFVIVSSVINIIGLIVAIMIWIERQEAYSVGIGLVFMAIGCGIYFISQSLVMNKKKTKLLFIIVNVWILLLIPLSCCFNIFDAILGGFCWELSPIPLLGNSYITYFIFWLLYLMLCISVDRIMIKRLRDGFECEDKGNDLF